MGQRPTHIFRSKLLNTSILFLLFSMYSWAQISVTAASGTITPEQIIETVFLGDGVEVTSITHQGATNSTGFFTDGLADIGIERGIVMGSGNVAEANNEANFFSSSDVGGPTSDVDLDAIVDPAFGVFDVSRYEITFIPAADTLRFRYSFASEEYPEFSCSPFNDIFGFFITGPNPAGGMYNSENIALVPDLADPTGLTFTNLEVSIENVHPMDGPGCPASFDEYYNDNSPSTSLAYDGFLNVFTAQAIVTPCEEYVMKLKIADVGDPVFDSAVFLEAKSFGTGSVQVDISTVSLDGTIAEGCNSAILTISIPTPKEEDFTVDAAIINCDDGATIDVDYTGLPSEFIIPAGETRVEYEVFAIEDGITEGDENICFDIQRDICNRDTVIIKIVETPLEQPIIPNDTLICQGESINLNSSLPASFILPPSPMFSSDETVQVNPEFTEFTIDIDVTDVFPEYIAPNLIERICIDSVEHPLLNDLDFFLITPSGFFLELSTDNGKGSPEGKMINTCFTPGSLININNGNPLAGDYFPAMPTFTGDFQIEGVWEDLYGEESESNGTYSLVFIDDETGGLGVVSGWSITFQALYNLDFVWYSDVDGAICMNCNDVDVQVDESTMYYLEVQDSYGCTLTDSFFVEIVDLALPVDNFVCDSLAPQYIRVTWDPAPGASGYTIFIPGVIDPPLDIGNVTEWAISTGLNSSTDYDITVTPTGGLCGGQSTTITCSTPQCLVDDLVFEELSGVSCNGDADGVLDVLITGNFPPFLYTFRGDTNGDGSYIDLAPSVADEDTLYIEDATGCVSKFPIVIPEPNPLAINFINKSEIRCFDSNDGSVTAQITGGTNPYSFVWESGSITNMATGLSTGFESITVTDLNNCEIIDSIFFDVPDMISATFVSSDVSCFGGMDGEAAVNPSGGTVNSNTDYQFAWGDPENQTGFSADNLAAGIYIVTITDLNDCTGTVEVIIDQPDPIVTSVMGSDILCHDSTNGTATVTVMGDNPPFEFEWDNGEMTNPAVSLNVGTRYVTVTDANDCMAIDSVVIGAPDSITVDFTIDSVSCLGNADGLISWVTQGGVEPITVSVNGITVVSPIVDVPVGEYCFVFTDVNMCTVTQCVDVFAPDTMIITGVLLEESCFNATDAAIDISIENGVSPYTFSWEGPGMFSANSEDLLNVDSGDYSVTVTDSDGCTSSAQFTLIEPEEILIIQDIFNIQCKNENTGFINIAVSGGVEPYEYEWIGPNGFTSNEEDIINLFAGTYTLIFKDAANCIIQVDYTVTEPDQGIQANISPDDQICFGATNGIASINPSGGTLPYDVTWSNDSKFTNINGLSPGTYTVTVVDGSNCSTVESVEIIELPEINIETVTESSLCFESLDGSAIVSGITTGGVSQNLDDYTYLWTSSPNQFDVEAINLKGGQDLQVIVTDNLGCTAVTQVEIPTPDPVSARVELIDSINCAQGDDGAIVIEGTGGNGFYDFQWGQGTNFQTGPDAKNLRAGTYNVTVTDQFGCTGVEEFTISDPFPITLNFRIFDVLCFGEESGEVELIANGGIQPYDLNWSNGESEDEITNLDIGTYYITVTDAKDCEVSDSVVVDQPEEPLSFDITTLDVDCSDGQNGSIIIDASGGAGNYIYSLDNFLFNASTEQIGLSEGTYNVYVKDANGCIDSLNGVDIFSPAPLELELGPDVYLNFGENYQFEPQIDNFQTPLVFKWESPDLDLLSCDDCLNPFFDAQRQASYRLVVQDARDCIVDDFINVFIENSDAIFVPTGFTPNGDFNNDLLSVYGIEGVQINVFRVYDRWGEVVFEDEDFEVNDASRGWNGMFKGKEMMPGVYTWVVEAEFTNGFKDVYSGNTTLIK